MTQDVQVPPHLVAELEKAMLRSSLADKYPKYHKKVPEGVDTLDTYAVNQMFPVDDPSGCIIHARKKLLIPGVRSGGKTMHDDIREARDTLNRWLAAQSQLTTPMDIFKHPLTNLILQPPVDMTPEDCDTLPVVTGVLRMKDDGPDYRFISSFWKPSVEELQKLNAGEPIQVRTLGSNFPPMLVTVGDKDFKD